MEAQNIWFNLKANLEVRISTKQTKIFLGSYIYMYQQFI